MIVASEKLRLRYHQPGDAADLFAMYTGDIESAKYLARLPHTNINQTEQMLQRLSNPQSLADTGKCIWVVEATAEGNAVGLITVVNSDETTTVHFGIGAPYRGRSYAAKALELTANYLLSTEQAKSVSSFTDAENSAAQSALVKAGFVFIDRVENFYVAPQMNGESRDVFRYQFGA